MILACALVVAVSVAAYLVLRSRMLARELNALAADRESTRDEDRLFRSLVQHSSDLILLLDEDGTIRYASAAAERTLGRRPSDVVGAKVVDLAHPEDRLKVQALIAEALSSTSDAPSADFRLHRGAGPHWVHVEAVATNPGDEPPVGALAVALRDITRRKWAEEALRSAERRYRSLVEQIPLVTYLDNVDETSSAIYMSPQIVPLLGYSLDDWLRDGDLFVKLLHPEDRERVLAEIAASHAGGSSFVSEYRLVGRDGQVVWFHDESLTVRNDDGTPLYVQGYMLDITAERANGNGGGVAAASHAAQR